MTSSTHNNVVVAHNFDDKKRTDDVFVTDNIDFDGLMLSSTVLSGLKSSGFVKPSPIQLKAIPLGRCGLDLIVQAKSGTGKTCVFSVISLESLQVQSSALQVLVLAPTREIAVQIWQVITNIGQNISGLACHTFIGGMPLTEDKQKLKKCQIAIGTPGRIKQLIESSFLSVENIRVFVLDEADKLLEESFQEQVNWIYSTLPENKQMIALSATYPEYLAQHLTAYMRNPTFLRLNIHDPALLGIRQFYATVPFSPLVHKVFECKTKKIVEILSTVSFQQCLIFSNLQTRAQNMSEELTNQGWPTACIAGSHDQKDRNEAMSQLKGYKCRVLISTDLTARGIDADKVDLVINLDVPKNHETYLHRIGRAGRFGTFGAAISIVSTGKELQDLRKVEEKCNTYIMELPVPIPKNLPKAECTLTLDDVVSSKQIITSPKSKEQSLKSITSDGKKSEINHGLSLDNVEKNCDLEVAPLSIEKGLQNRKTVLSSTSDNDYNQQAKTEIQLETSDILDNSKIMKSLISGNNSTNEGNFNQNNVQALCNEVKEMSLKENGFENINTGAKMLSQNEDDEMLFVPAAPRQLVSISLPSLAEVIGYENIEEPHTYATAAKEERTWIKTEEVEKDFMNLKYSLNNKSQIIDNIQELLRIGYLKKAKNVSPAVQIEQVSNIFTETVSSSENPSLKLSAISRKFIVNGDTKDDVTQQDYQEYENDLRACQNENHTTEPVLEELSAITENETPSLKDQVADKTRKIPNNKSYMLVGGTLERLRKDEANNIEAVESVEGVDKHSNFSFNRNLPGQRSEWDSHDETDTSEESYSEEDSASITGEEGGETVKEGLSYSEYCRLNNLTADNVKEDSSSTEESDDIVDEEDCETDDPHGAYNSDSCGLFDDHYSSLHDEHEHRNENESSKHWHEPYSNGASNGYSYHPWTYWPHMYSSPWGPAYPSGMFHNPYVFGCYPVHFNSHQYSYPQECPSKHDKVNRRKAWKQFQEIQAATKKYYDEQEKHMKSMLHK